MSVNNILLLLVLLVALFTDLRWRKIYNWLTVPAFLLGLAWQFYIGGLAREIAVLRGILLVFVILIMLFAAGGFGGGDVKLALAVTALAGFPESWTILAYSAIAGGVLALLYLLWNKGQLKIVGRFFHRFFLAVFLRTSLPEPEQQNIEQRKFPYSTAILAGFILSFFLKL